MVSKYSLLIFFHVLKDALPSLSSLNDVSELRQTVCALYEGITNNDFCYEGPLRLVSTNI